MFQRISPRAVKVAVAWLLAFVFRLIPFRPIGAEPILAAVMPVSKRYGIVASFVFAFLSIAIYDLFTSGIGAWTYATAFAYGLVSIASGLYFKSRPASRGHFLAFGIIGTLAYDALTGLTFGPVFYHQSFKAALIGQIPFTIEHLLGTAAFALLVSPLLYRWFENEALFAPFGALVRSRT